MNQVEREARDILHAEAAAWRLRPYRELVGLIGAENHWERLGADGQRFGLEVVVHWDDKKGGPVRVIGMVDDGGPRSLMPWTEDFIKAPDESFVNE
jgi:hypothetical protein